MSIVVRRATFEPGLVWGQENCHQVSLKHMGLPGVKRGLDCNVNWRVQSKAMYRSPHPS